MGTYLYRLLGACALDGGTYEAIDADRRSIVMVEALLTVLLSSLAAAFGSFGLFGYGLQGSAFVAGLALVTWIAWAMLTLQIGTRVLPEAETSTSLGELLRSIGFAAAPGLLQVFAVLPGMTRLVFAATWSWMLIAMVVAVRHALDFHSTRRALAVCGLAALLSVALAVIFAVLFAPVTLSLGR